MRIDPNCILCKDNRPVTFILKCILSETNYNFMSIVKLLLMTYISHYFKILGKNVFIA